MAQTTPLFVCFVGLQSPFGAHQPQRQGAQWWMRFSKMKYILPPPGYAIQTSLWDGKYNSPFTDEETNNREIKWPAQGHTVRMWPGSAGLRPRLCTAHTSSASQQYKVVISWANNTRVYFASPAVELLLVPSGSCNYRALLTLFI